LRYDVGLTGVLLLCLLMLISIGLQMSRS